MKTLLIVFLAALLLTGTDVRPVFMQLFYGLGVLIQQNGTRVTAAPAPATASRTAAHFDLPAIDSPTATTVEDLTLDDALNQADSMKQALKQQKDNPE